MPTADQHNQPHLAPEDMPGEHAPESTLGHVEATPSREEEAPFLGLEEDPGLAMADGAEGEEGAEAAEPPEPIVYRELDSTELQAAVEATFFMHHRPLTVAKIRELVNPNIDEEEYRSAISNLMASYFEENRGIELVEVANGFQFRTKAVHKDIVRRMYQIAPMKLTNAMLEVLAIAAYNQPLTREGVDKIRGVDSSHLVRVLLDKKMLRIAGKSDDLGRPMLYATTKEFLELFGLRDLGALPSLREIEEMIPQNEVGNPVSEEEALASEMEGIVEASKPLEFNDDGLEEWEEGDETQKNNEEPSPAVANRDRGPKSDGSAEAGSKADGDVDFTTEASRRLPVGPEGNA